MSLDSDSIRHALKTAREFGFHQVKIRAGEDSFRAVLSSSPSNEIEETPVEEFAIVTSSEPAAITLSAPVVGYFQDGGKPLTVGMKLKEGQVVAEVTALGLANDVVSPCDGEIVEVFVSAGDPVGYGHILAKVKRK
ncbi:MAG: hypothetical protein K8R88_04925 [Armatimonadetes bacterium]|nr:hypothetical protein [Armatimonadota bacterium]